MEECEVCGGEGCTKVSNLVCTAVRHDVPMKNEHHHQLFTSFDIHN